MVMCPLKVECYVWAVVSLMRTWVVGRDWGLGEQHVMGLRMTLEEISVVVDEFCLLATLS